MADDTQLVKRKPGRPPIISVNPAVKEQILQYIRDGAYMLTAFRAAGVSDECYYTWMDLAESRSVYSSQFKEFIAQLKRAEAEAEIKALITMRGTKGAFLPEATFLERRFRDRWGRSDKHQIDTNVNIRIATVDYNKLLKQMSTKKTKSSSFAT